MSKPLYGIVSPSDSENLIIAISYNEKKLIEYYKTLKSVDSDMNIIMVKTDYDLEENILLPFGMSEAKKI